MVEISEVKGSVNVETTEEKLKKMNKIPFFMTELDDDEENVPLQALKALAFEGTPDEVAENFRQQGNDCYRTKQYKDAVQYYTKAIDQHSGDSNLEIACFGNRAQCNLELRNYRSCVNDCIKVLEIDHDNIKAWYRSAKAFQKLDRLDESITCCDYGLSVDPANEAILGIKDAVLKRKQQLKDTEDKRQAREIEKKEEERVYQLALDQRNITRMYTEKNENYRSNAGDLSLELEDSANPSSDLCFPMLFLYPTSMESDIIQKASEHEAVGALIERLFEKPPSWVSTFTDYKLGNLDVFAPTSSGGLAKVGLKSTLIKIYGTKQPNITTVDNMGRLYVVPKNQTKSWLESWPTSKQLLYP